MMNLRNYALTTLIGAVAMMGLYAHAADAAPPALAPGDTGFDVSQFGWSFNNNWPSACFSVVGGTTLRYDPHGLCVSGSFGFCGGMSLLAGERYLAGTPSSGLTQDQVKGAIEDAQMKTLDEETVAHFLLMISSPNEGHTLDPLHSVGYWMADDWDHAIMPRLALHEPVVIGLIFDEDASFADLAIPIATTGLPLMALKDVLKQHQVLAIGYTESGGRIQLRAYDPNYQGDVLNLTFTRGHAGVDQKRQSGQPLGSDRRSVRALMFVRGVSARQAEARFCPSGKFSTTGEDHGCTCETGKKSYGGVFKSEAWCEGAVACPNKHFTTTGEWRGCACPAGKKKEYHGAFNSEADCR
jgi:hypothetical protein